MDTKSTHPSLKQLSLIPLLLTTQNCGPSLVLLISCHTSTNTLATLLALLRPLLSTKNEFLWSTLHKEAFNQVKQSLTTSPLLSFFAHIFVHRYQQTRISFYCTTKDRREMDFHSSWFVILVRHRDMVCFHWVRTPCCSMGHHEVWNISCRAATVSRDN